MPQAETAFGGSRKTTATLKLLQAAGLKGLCADHLVREISRFFQSSPAQFSNRRSRGFSSAALPVRGLRLCELVATTKTPSLLTQMEVEAAATRLRGLASSRVSASVQPTVSEFGADIQFLPSKPAVEKRQVRL